MILNNITVRVNYNNELFNLFFGPETKGRSVQSRAISWEYECYLNDDKDSKYSGANDLIVVKQKDGHTLKANPFQLRVGRSDSKTKERDGVKGKLYVKDKLVTIDNVEFVLNGAGQLMIQRETKITKIISHSCIFNSHELVHLGLTEGHNKAKMFFV